MGRGILSPPPCRGRELVMVKYLISFNGINSIVNFAKMINKYPCNIDVKSGHFYLDAKSIMVLFSLNTSAPIQIRLQTEDEQIINAFQLQMKEYILPNKNK